MFRSSVAWVRARGSMPHQTSSFDGYPYLVTRIGHIALRHNGGPAASWSRERLLDLTRRQALANRLDTCLVLGPGTAIYVTADAVEWETDHVPTGIPVVERLSLAEKLPRT